MISGENLELVDVPVASIPEGAIDSVEAIVGKYAVIDMVLGEYVFERMLTTEAPENAAFWADVNKKSFHISIFWLKIQYL